MKVIETIFERVKPGRRFYYYNDMYIRIKPIPHPNGGGERVNAFSCKYPHSFVKFDYDDVVSIPN